MTLTVTAPPRPSTRTTETALELRGITKRFPGVVANDGVDLAVVAGEVHALLGENGAGKTTLSHVVTGLYQPDAGEMRLYGAPVRFASPRAALAAGICMVHQHFRLVEPFTVAENIMLGDLKGAGSSFLIDAAAVERAVLELGSVTAFQSTRTPESGSSRSESSSGSRSSRRSTRTRGS